MKLKIKTHETILIDIDDIMVYILMHIVMDTYHIRHTCTMFYGIL